MDFKAKSESLAKKMNSITEKFTENLDLADDLLVDGDDVVDFVEQKTKDVKLHEEIPATEIINLENMVADFNFVRSTLKENTENARKVLSHITLDLINEDDDKRASLVMSFAELNKAVADNMKLYITAYKDISSVLTNLDKIQQRQKAKSPKTVNNNFISGETISTVDLIKKLGEKND